MEHVRVRGGAERRSDVLATVRRAFDASMERMHRVWAGRAQAGGRASRGVGFRQMHGLLWRQEKPGGRRMPYCPECFVAGKHNQLRRTCRSTMGTREWVFECTAHPAPFPQWVLTTEQYEAARIPRPAPAVRRAR